MFALISVRVELHGLLAEGKKRHLQFTFAGPLIIGDLLDQLDLPPDRVGMVVVNGKMSGRDYYLRDGDSVYLAPFMQGG